MQNAECKIIYSIQNAKLPIQIQNATFLYYH